MPDDSQIFDPYRSPSLPEGPYAGAPPSGRPGTLTTLCVICIVLGALGLLNSVLGAAGVVGGRQLQAMLRARPSPGLSPDLQEAQEKLQDDMNAALSKYLWPLIAGLVIRFGVASLLLLGGIRALSLHESGRKVLLVACALAVPFELVQSILQSVINLENMTAMNSFSESLASELSKGNGAPNSVAGFAQTFMRAVMIGSLVVAYVIALAKIILYVFGLVYLQKKHIRGLFTSSPSTVKTPVS